MKLHGKNGSVYLNGTRLTTATQYQISIESDYADISVFSDLGKTFARGLRAAAGTFDGIMDVGADYATVAAQSDVPIVVTFYAGGPYPTLGPAVASGLAYVDVSVSSGVEDAVRLHGTVKGIGAWTVGP